MVADAGVVLSAKNEVAPAAPEVVSEISSEEVLTVGENVQSDVRKIVEFVTGT